MLIKGLLAKSLSYVREVNELAVDAMQDILTLLSDNWTSANTNSLTPNFLKITAQKRYDYNDGQDVIFAHRTKPLQEPAGVGARAKHVFHRLNLDVRVKGKQGNTQESHFFNVITEVDRIMDANIINPTANFIELDPDGDRQDLSDKTHFVFRMLIPISLNQYALSRT